MRKRRHTPDTVIRKLAEGEKLLAQGRTLAEVVRHLEIAASTWPSDAQSDFESRLVLG